MLEVWRDRRTCRIKLERERLNGSGESSTCQALRALLRAWIEHGGHLKLCFSPNHCCDVLLIIRAILIHRGLLLLGILSKCKCVPYTEMSLVNWLQCRILTPKIFTQRPWTDVLCRGGTLWGFKSRVENLASNILFPKHRILKFWNCVSPKYETFYGK